MTTSLSAVILGPFQDEILAADQLAAADEENLHAGFAIGARHGDHIRIHLGRRRSPFGFRPLARWPGSGRGWRRPSQSAGLPQPVSISRLQAVDDRFGLPFQELAQIIDHLAVFSLVDRADTRPGAQLDIVIQAGARILTGDLAVAGQVGEDPAQHIQGLVDRPDAGVGTKIA